MIDEHAGLRAEIFNHGRSFAAYGVTSVCATIVEFTVLHATLAMSLASTVAISFGYVSGSFCQFCMLRYIVFRVTDKPVVLQLNAYLFGGVLAWLCVLAAVTLLQSGFHLSTMIARAISIPLLFPMNYLISRYFIFRK